MSFDGDSMALPPRRENDTTHRRVRRDKPLWSELNLKKEEVRGVFAIGVIAALISLRVYFSTVAFSLPSYVGIIKLPQVELFDLLIILWTLYVLFTTLALADDVLVSIHPSLEKFSESSRIYAHALFASGIFLITAVAILLFWPPFLLLTLFYVWIRYHRSKSLSSKNKFKK
jgi:hypothetical protein